MSKASDYAKAIKEAESQIRPELRASISGDRVARVLNSGNLDLFYRAPMHPDLALTLAHWIIDTFSDDAASRPDEKETP